MFDASGHFTRAIVPAEQGSATAIVADFGNYSVTNGGKPLVRRVLGSQNPGIIGKDLPIEITLKNDELKTSNPTPSVSGTERAESVWKRVK